jgi:hypothetical protein
MASGATRDSSNGRKALTAQEIIELGACLTEVFRVIREMHEAKKVAKHIKYPPLPAVFSESIVIAATSALFGPIWTTYFGGRLCDLLLESNDGLTQKRVEVKATGRHAFQELKDKDLQADFLVWLRFGRRFESGSGPIEVAVLEAPGKYITEPRRLDVTRFEAIPGVVSNQRLFRFDSLEDLVGGRISRVRLAPHQ